MIIATPSDYELCVAPELAVLTVLETTLAISVQILNIAHTEPLAPGNCPHHPNPDTRVAAQIIAEATNMIASIRRYRSALLDPDAFPL